MMGGEEERDWEGSSATDDAWKEARHELKDAKER